MKMALALMCSVLLVLNVFTTMVTCFSIGACGTPCASAAFTFQISPIFLTLPFLHLLWARTLSRDGLVARGAVTCATAVWLVALVVMMHTSRSYLLF